ncbi:MAG TPA: LysR family transcriptional regulator [Pseudoclavibacter sp.]|nr:LysR family transcriptional regulator [Pseudoclavibacter sp.]
MNFERLMLLHELAAHGTITAAARATFRTPSAVSQQLKLLEKEVGVQLLEPSGRGVRLTEAGHILADGALEVQTVLNRIEAVIDDFKTELRGEVLISTFPTAGEMLLPGTIRRLEDSPGIHIECTDRDALANEYVTMLTDFHVVLAYAEHGNTPWLHKDVISTPLLTEPVDVVIPADHPLAQKKALTAHDVISVPWIGSPEGFPFDVRRRIIEQAAGTRAHIVQRVADNHLASAFVSEGIGIAFLPRFTTAPRAGDGFALRPLRGISLARDIVALTRRDHHQRRVIQRVLSALVDEAHDVVARNASA